MGRVRVVRRPAGYRAFLPLIMRGYYGGDPYEPDGSPGQARLLPLGSPQRHDFGMAEDADWTYLELVAGTPYLFATSDLAGGADTWLALYAPGDYGAPLLENDDCTGQTLASCIRFTPATTGRYELRATNISGLWGPGVQYTLEAREEVGHR